MSKQTSLSNWGISNWNKLRKLIVCCTVLFSTIALAHAQPNSYSVQVGAFSSPSPTLADAYKQYGSVLIEFDGGFSRVLIGAFESKDDAELLLMELQRDGFNDAFVRRTTAATAVTSTAPGSHEHVHLPAPDQRRLDQLSDAEKSRTVYLDGVLHIKEGDSFTRLQ